MPRMTNSAEHDVSLGMLEAGSAHHTIRHPGARRSYLNKDDHMIRVIICLRGLHIMYRFKMRTKHAENVTRIW